jgi:hypothetical protein
MVRESPIIVGREYVIAHRSWFMHERHHARPRTRCRSAQ